MKGEQKVVCDVANGGIAVIFDWSLPLQTICKFWIALSVFDAGEASYFINWYTDCT